ncbi:hypothetical protein U9M48_015180 [Paspalum notatum var. saurae]|uniref:Uncharacterized protein n=1 Tax=Paspalum notatum var. saurae TaxID=547442 RepID=A0AAQ3T616_PASNO
MDRRPPLAVSPRRLRPRPHRAPRPPLVPATSVKTPPASLRKAAAPMRASMCAIPSPVRFDPSPIRASISALPSPVRAEPSPMRASVAAAPTRAKLDFPAVASPPPRSAAGKENVLPAAAAALAPPPAAQEESLVLPAGADAHDELVALNLAAVARAAGTGGPVFVRGRLYDRYSARRNERLKRKHGFPYYEDSASAAAVDVDPEAMAEDPCVAVELSKRRVAKKAYAATGAESVRRSMPAGDFAAARGGGLGPRSSLRNSKEMKKASAASGVVSQAVKERRVSSSPIRASISALPSPVRAEPSPMRASVAAAPTRAKLDFPAVASPPPRSAAGKENVLPAAAAALAPPPAAQEESLVLPAGADAHDELVALNLAAVARAAGTGGPVFVRGRLYDRYSARRNERLKRKHGFPYYEDSASAAAVDVDPEAMAEDPCVAVELSKRRVAKKAYAATGAESVRRSMPAGDFAAARGGGLGPRSSLRNSKEMKKASAASGVVSQAVKERRVSSRSSTRRI